ncbi:MAG: bifunctional metallophosphatase/5'-nucleotidase [Chlorobiales bacterium]|nr:bifunctional metallophosphatase/5'-nucleotidase [Chlorobiales bacterium]
MKYGFTMLCATMLMFALSGQTAASGHEKEIAIVYTCNTNGYIEACACSKNNLGGLARRMTALNALRKEHKGNMLLLDAGNIFSSFQRSTRHDRVVATIVKRMNYDAVNLGNQEFVYGQKFLRQNKPSETLLSLNILDTKGNHVGQPYLIKNVSGVKVAITGLLTMSAFSNLSDTIKAGLSLQEPFEALKPALADIKRKKPDLTVLLLCSLDYQLEKKLAEAYPEIDLIISCTEDLATDPLTKYGNTIATSAGHDGEKVGCLTVRIDTKQKQVKAFSNKLIDLDPAVRPDAEIFSLTQTPN